MDSMLDEETREEVGAPPSRRVPTWFVVALVAAGLGYGVIALVGRSGNPDPAEALADAEHDDPKPTLINPCSLVTPEEAAEILGPVGSPGESPGMGVVPDQRACYYPLADDARGGVIIGVLEHAEGMNLAGIGRDFGMTPEFVPGIGDDAQWLAPFRLLAVAVGDTFLSVQFAVPEEDPREAVAKAAELAALAVGRL